MKIGTVLLCSALCASAMSAACGQYRPPFTQAAKASPPPDDHQATLVFLWPTTSCDPGGYYVLATEDGRFLGTISTGTQLRTTIPPGNVAIVGWNEPQEKARGEVVKSAVSVLHATLAEERTYYVQLQFGEWDERGPRDMYTGRMNQEAHRACIAPDKSMTTDLARINPASPGWNDLVQWRAELDVLVPDPLAGQAWLDGNRSELEYHRAVAEERYARLRPVARRMATLEDADGVPSSR